MAKATSQHGPEFVKSASNLVVDACSFGRGHPTKIPDLRHGTPWEIRDGEVFLREKLPAKD
jgi:hypothetical protein